MQTLQQALLKAILCAEDDVARCASNGVYRSLSLKHDVEGIRENVLHTSLIVLQKE